MTSLDRSRPPRPGSPRQARFPAFQRRELTSGLELVTARTEKWPLVQLIFLSGGGGQHDPSDRWGLASLTGALLDEGTARRSAIDIALAVEQLGGRLSSGADWDSSFVEAACLSRHLQPCLELLAEVALEPAFPHQEVERVKKLALAELLKRKSHPGALAEKAFARTVFQGTPYEHLLLGEEHHLEAVTRDDTQEFYQRHVATRPATLVAVGDLDPTQMTSLAEELFADLPKGKGPPAPVISPQHPGAPRIVIVDRPDAPQTELRIGHVGVPRGTPERATLKVLNSLLGGKFTSRINLNLRERNGYTYGAWSRFVQRLGPGPFQVSAAVSNEVAGPATVEVLKELRHIREEPVLPEELEDTRSYLLGVFPYTLQGTDNVAKRLEEIVVYSLPDTEVHDQLAAIAAVTAADILHVAQTRIHPDRITVVAVGPAADLEPQFAEIGAVEVVEA